MSESEYARISSSSRSHPVTQQQAINILRPLGTDRKHVQARYREVSESLKAHQDKIIDSLKQLDDGEVVQALFSTMLDIEVALKNLKYAHDLLLK